MSIFPLNSGIGKSPVPQIQNPVVCDNCGRTVEKKLSGICPKCGKAVKSCLKS